MSHAHRCQDCGMPAPCDGTWERNVDGFPEVICAAFHLEGGRLNPEFVCASCRRKREKER